MTDQLTDTIAHLAKSMSLPEVNAGHRSQMADLRKRLDRLDAERTEAERKQRRWDAIASAIGRRYARCSFDTFDCTMHPQTRIVEHLRDFARDYARHRQVGLVFLGPRGSGKDHLAVATIRDCIQAADVSAAWSDCQSLFGAIRQGIATKRGEMECIRSLLRADILLLSDPVPPDGKLTDYQQSTLWQIVDRRYRDRRPTWITCNATNEQEMVSKMGAQLVDRLIDGAQIISTVGWRSRRAPHSVIS